MTLGKPEGAAKRAPFLLWLPPLQWDGGPTNLLSSVRRPRCWGGMSQAQGLQVRGWGRRGPSRPGSVCFQP